ncbi:hypothetical protein BOX15_Mlig023066g1, partial [Macrostomum lignano]
LIEKDMADLKLGKQQVSAYAAYQRLKQQPPAIQLQDQQVNREKKRQHSNNSTENSANAATGSSKKKKAKLQEQSVSAKVEKAFSKSPSTTSTTSSSKKLKPQQHQVASNGAALSGKKKKRKKRNKQSESCQPKQDGLVASAMPIGSDSSAEIGSNSDTEDDSVIDPIVEATEVFKEIIAPISTEQFFGTYWERKPLLVKRNSPSHYDDWFSTADFDSMLRNHRVMFGEHLDVTSYRDGKRETHNPEGRALVSQTWQFYQSGCSLRLLCPQVFHDRVYQKLSILHELFGSFVGANVYLTPPGTQGFAPHWDDIEAFVMQLEGRKHWRVYAPRSPNERLPRESSGNFGPKDRLGQPVIDAVLEPGDLLYMPRGFIHQGRCLDGWHSLHITVSTYQKFAWTDLLAEAISGALERATTQDEEFRRGLPLGLLGFAGSAFGSLTAASRDDWANRRREAEEFCRSLLARLSGHISLDEAADRIACGQVRDALPPALDPSEASCSAFGAGPVWDARRGRLTAAPPAVTLKSRIRLVRRSAARLTGDGRLHSSLGNTRVFREAEPAYLDVEPALAPGVAALAAAYPTFLTVAELPIADPEDRVALAAGLHDRGLLLVREQR